MSEVFYPKSVAWRLRELRVGQSVNIETDSRTLAKTIDYCRQIATREGYAVTFEEIEVEGSKAVRVTRLLPPSAITPEQAAPEVKTGPVEVEPEPDFVDVEVTEPRVEEKTNHPVEMMFRAYAQRHASWCVYVDGRESDHDAIRDAFRAGAEFGVNLVKKRLQGALN